MKKVESINSVNVDNETIETLKSLLQKAENGKLRSIVFVDKYQNGDVGHGWAGAPDREMIGEMESLKFEFFCQAWSVFED